MLFFTTSGALLILAISFGRPGFSLKQTNHTLIASYFVIGLAVSLYTVASRFFVSDRYIFLPALLLCIPIPFLFNKILTNKTRSWHYRSVLRSIIFLTPAALILIPILSDTNKKIHIRDTAQWVNENLSPQEDIYYNDQKLAFYSGDYANQSFQLQDVSFQKLYQSGYRYAVINNKKPRLLTGPESLANDKGLELLYSQSGPRNANVSVYKLLNPGE